MQLLGHINRAKSPLADELKQLEMPNLRPQPPPHFPPVQQSHRPIRRRRLMPQRHPFHPRHNLIHPIAQRLIAITSRLQKRRPLPPARPPLVSKKNPPQKPQPPPPPAEP